MYRNLANSSRNSYDPDNYDPTVAGKYNNADGSGGAYATQEAKPGQKMQVNITLANPTATNLMFEVFSYLDSMIRRKKAEYATGAFLYVPYLSFEGIIRYSGATDTGGVVGFDQDGNCLIFGANAAAAKGKISCKEIAYASFFEASAVVPFEVGYIRYTCSTDPQIDETIVWFQKSFSGGVKENVISPRSFQKPTNNLEKVIDITAAFPIGLDKGIRTLVLAGESVRLALFIQLWTVQGVN